MEKCDLKIPNIEKELNVPPENKKQIKACLFTLVIYASTERQVNYFQDLIRSILDKFPCRIIFIHVDAQATLSCLHVKVSTVQTGQGSSQGGGTVIACDQILIEVSKDQLFRIPFLVVPHLVPDLPVYLLWGQNPFEEHNIFPHLQSYASRVIFDSECSDDLDLFCKEMQNNLEVLKMDIMDINWALLSNWRDLLTQLFDTSERITQLQNCKSIVITYNHSKTETFQHPEIRAIYMQGWLASCMKWQFHQIEKFTNNVFISYSSNSKPVVIVLAPQTHPELPPGAIVSIEITTTTENSFMIIRNSNLPQVLVHVSSLDTCELPFTLPLPNIHRGLSFMKEVFYSSLGDHYLDMLKTISKLDYKQF